MTNTNETIADIIAEMRRQAERIRNNLSTVPVRQWDQQAEIKSLEDDADRLEAAWKREKSAIEADALAVGGMVEASRATAKKSLVVGDAAKLREAVKELLDAMYDMGVDEETVSIAAESPNCHMHSVELLSVIKKAKAALAKPMRNCDKYSHDEALRIWSAEPENPMNGCFDVWLYAPATGQEGEVNGNK